jgi:hypothetical protein
MNSPVSTIKRFNDSRGESHRRPKGREILADLDQERRHRSKICVLALYEQRVKREAKKRLVLRIACLFGNL